MAAQRRRLTDAGIARLAPAVREYTVWDTRQAGLGVRVRPSGHRSFVYCPKGDDKARRITLGPTALTSVGDARSKCRVIETTARLEPTEHAAVPTFEEFVRGPGQVCIDRCKPSTLKAVRWVLNAHLLPTFGALPLDRITCADVTRWFDEYSRTAPGGANHALSVLRRILNHAVECEHLQTNPAQSVKRNPRPKLTRFLSREEITRLHRVLDHYGRARPSRVQQADVIRLLLLTGCRRSEILTLRWQDIDRDALKLTDAKTGSRRVILNAPARAILERQPRSGNAYIFPSPVDSKRPLSCDLRLWYSVRKEAGIEDVRLHDLRHTFASHAVLRGTLHAFGAYLIPHLKTGSRPAWAVTELVDAGHRGLPSGRGVYGWSARDGAALLEQREEELFRHLARDRHAPDKTRRPAVRRKE